jgi:hypothetical protein
MIKKELEKALVEADEWLASDEAGLTLYDALVSLGVSIEDIEAAGIKKE